MSSQLELLELCLSELEAGRPVVRAVIIRTWGSTPREVGADMVVTSQGRLAGTVGGGCGEAEVYELSLALLQEPGARGHLLHIDLTEDPEEGGGKVCGGRFDVLLSKLSTFDDKAELGRLMTALEQGQCLTLRTDLGPARSGFWKEGLVSLPVVPRWSADSLSGSDCRLEEGGHSTVFHEPLGLAHRLIIVGAGHIARPLSTMASLAGYQVVVLDDRQDYAQRVYFPQASQVLHGPYGELLPNLVAGVFTSVVLVTRGHRHDQECLRLVVDRPLAYLGMIGSKRRVEAVFHDLIAEGFEKESLARVCAPIGLEIGAHTPAEIAISILAEMIFRRRSTSSAGREPLARRRKIKVLDQEQRGPESAEPG